MIQGSNSSPGPEDCRRAGQGKHGFRMVSGWFLDGFWIVSGWFPDGFLVLGCSHGAVALARQKRKRRDEQRLRTDASVSELTRWPGNLSALRAYAICAAGVALGWSPKRVNCLHHLPDKALNDRAKEGFIRIKAEPDERPGVCPVICTGNVVGTPCFYLNLSLVAREGESSKWWAISGSKCLSCQMRHLCWSINSSNCFHMWFYIFIIIYFYFSKTSNFSRIPTRMKMRRTKRLSSLCSIRAQASETLKDTVAQEEKMVVRYILYTTASVDICTFMGFGFG